MGYQSEAELEAQLMAQLKGQDFSEVRIADEEELRGNFMTQFVRFNAGSLDVPLSNKEWDRIANVTLGKSVFESAKVIRDKFVLQRDDGSRVYLSFFSADDPTKNVFQVAHQTAVEGRYRNRFDVTILVNGLPLIQIELKRRGIDVREAVNQVMRYKKHSYTGFYHYIQLFVVSNGVDTKYFANSDRPLLHSQAFFWTDRQNIRITNLKEFALAFLARDHVVRMMSRYMILNDTDRLLMVMRPYQVYAVEALVRQARVTSRNAYIWHTTGAGKTLTAFKTAQILAAEPTIRKVVFLVDRKDLDSQTIEEFNKFERDSVDATDKTDVLVSQMRDKNRQLIVTTMQKMANAVKGSRYAKVMDAYKNEKVVFIIDECHRSQFGDMHRDIVRHFAKAQFFGFTGTPRFEVNGMVEGHRTLTTEALFGECLHNYLIKDAIFDNNVLGFHIEYVKTIKGDYDLNDRSVVSGIDTDEVYGSEDRLTRIANHIVSNHRTRTRNCQYTAIFAVSSIPILIRYYDILKKIDHSLSVGAIFTYGANEEAEGRDEHSRDALERMIRDYNEKFGTSFSTDTFVAYHKDVSDRVKGKKSQQLDILLVVDMFLTGFDSKPLSVLYVDKELQYHTLLQAYSRTNRVEKETKPFGIIICYRNLKQRTDEALALFSKCPAPTFGGSLTPGYEYYVEKFNEMALKLRNVALCPESVDTMQSEEDQRAFVVIFRELTKYLQAARTFVDFSFDKSVFTMSEQEYEDYKSKYLLLYTKRKNDRQAASILNDVDFCIELMESDRINVAYIMNLIRNIHFGSKKKDADIAHIKDELNRTDNPQLRKKVELLEAFLDSVVRGLGRGDDVDAAYNDFENEEKRKEIEAFANEVEMPAEVITEMVSSYEFSGVLDDAQVRDSIAKPLPLLKKIALANRITDFILTLTDKYQ